MNSQQYVFNIYLTLISKKKKCKFYSLLALYKKNKVLYFFSLSAKCKQTTGGGKSLPLSYERRWQKGDKKTHLPSVSKIGKKGRESGASHSITQQIPFPDRGAFAIVRGVFPLSSSRLKTKKYISIKIKVIMLSGKERLA